MPNECPRDGTRRPGGSFTALVLTARSRACLALSRIVRSNPGPGCRNGGEASRVCGLWLPTIVRLMTVLTTVETNVPSRLKGRTAGAVEKRWWGGISRVLREGRVRRRSGDDLGGRGRPVEGSPRGSFRVVGFVEKTWEGIRLLRSKGSPSLLDVLIREGCEDDVGVYEPGGDGLGIYRKASRNEERVESRPV